MDGGKSLCVVRGDMLVALMKLKLVMKIYSSIIAPFYLYLLTSVSTNI